MAPEGIFGQRLKPRDPEEMRRQLGERKEKLRSSLTTQEIKRADDFSRFHGGDYMFFSSIAIFGILLITVSNDPLIPLLGFGAAVFCGITIISESIRLAVDSALIAIRKSQLRQVEKQESALPPTPAKSE